MTDSRAAVKLIAAGRSPWITEVADAAEISRRTAYRYFPTQEQLLVEAAPEGLRPGIVDAVETPDAGLPDDVKTSVDRPVLALQRGAVANEQLLRTMIRLTVSRPSSTDEAGHSEPKRGYRRIEWIELALAPIRKDLGKKRYERLVSALTVCLGIDALIVLRVLRGLTDAEAEVVSLWTARTLMHASLAEKSTR